MNKNQRKFGIYVFLSTLSRSLIEVYIPVILYKSGYDLKEIVLYAKENYLVVSSDQFKFLEKYGLNIVSLDSKNNADKAYSDAKDAINAHSIKYIYLKKDEKPNDNINKLKDEFGLEIQYIDTLNNISTSDKKDGRDYITIMNENIDKLKQELY